MNYQVEKISKNTNSNPPRSTTTIKTPMELKRQLSILNAFTSTIQRNYLTLIFQSPLRHYQPVPSTQYPVPQRSSWFPAEIKGIAAHTAFAIWKPRQINNLQE